MGPLQITGGRKTIGGREKSLAIAVGEILGPRNSWITRVEDDSNRVLREKGINDQNIQNIFHGQKNIKAYDKIEASKGPPLSGPSI